MELGPTERLTEVVMLVVADPTGEGVAEVVTDPVRESVPELDAETQLDADGVMVVHPVVEPVMVG